MKNILETVWTDVHLFFIAYSFAMVVLDSFEQKWGRMYQGIFFLVAILWCSLGGNHPQKQRAKFGFRSGRIVHIF
jgi:hypothetical protein